MTTPDSPSAADSMRLTVLDGAIKRSKDAAVILNVGAIFSLVGWVAAYFIYPLPVLGWAALGFFALQMVYQTGLALIDHHIAMNTLVPLEFQMVQAQVVRDAMENLEEHKQAFAERTPSDQSGAKKASAIGLTGRKVN